MAVCEDELSIHQIVEEEFMSYARPQSVFELSRLVILLSVSCGPMRYHTDTKGFNAAEKTSFWVSLVLQSFAKLVLSRSLSG